MSDQAFEDDRLRRLALERLGAFGPELAREALESGVVIVEPDVLAWTGSSGAMHGHRVVLRCKQTLAARVNSTPSAVDALTSALAAAMASDGGNALAELAVIAGEGAPPAIPYRGRS